MRDSKTVRAAFVRAYVFLIAYLVVAGWSLSWAHRLDWLGLFSLAGLFAGILLARRGAESVRQWFQGLSEPLAYWPLLLVAVPTLAGALLYPITMLDSLSYRLPRILFWLQAGSVYHIPSAVDSMNYMPQVWELASIPLIQLAGTEWVFFWNGISWVVLYLTAFDWALEMSGDAKKSRAMAFLGSASTFAVLQASRSANDLFATVLILLSLRFVLAFERARDGREIVWSVLSFCLATGVKPHLAVLGLPLLLWFVASPAKPWQAFYWRWTPVWLALWLTCSPVPCFVMNYEAYGSWTGPKLANAMKGDNPLWNIALGTAMILWQTPEPPVNPAALLLNKPLEQAVEDSGLRQHVPRFNLKLSPVSMVDSASLGLVTAVLFVTGMFLAFRGRQLSSRPWPGWAAAAGLTGLILALSQVVAENSGRTFCAFLYLFLPLAMAGWNSLRPRTLRLWVYLSLLSSWLSLILNPAHPLWPVHWVQQELARSPRWSSLADGLEPYLLFPERARTGQDLIQAIPAGEPVVVVLIKEDHPLLPLFYPWPTRHKLVLLPPQATIRELNRTGARYVIVGGGADDVYPELCSYLEKSGDYSLVLDHDYTSKLTRGPETWKLYKQQSVSPAAGHNP